jgi:hypothetical protein
VEWYTPVITSWRQEDLEFEASQSKVREILSPKLAKNKKGRGGEVGRHGSNGRNFA